MRSDDEHRSVCRESLGRRVLDQPQTSAIRQRIVGEDQIEDLFAKRVEGLFRGRARAHGISRHVEQRREHVPNLPIVFNDQDSRLREPLRFIRV